mmetsp:Transcript_12229/g.24548  ORF Transcript_12229/g.24548 Transcript_12229/m.24548 type:complete len:151 (-) Transcript_12229:107-559(-)
MSRLARVASYAGWRVALPAVPPSARWARFDLLRTEAHWHRFDLLPTDCGGRIRTYWLPARMALTCGARFLPSFFERASLDSDGLFVDAGPAAPLLMLAGSDWEARLFRALGDEYGLRDAPVRVRWASSLRADHLTSLGPADCCCGTPKGW